MLDINKIVLWAGSALACISIILGAWFYVHHLQTEVSSLSEKAMKYAQVAAQDDQTIKQYEKDKVLNEKLLSDLTAKKETIRIVTDARKAQVAKEPDGSTPPAIVCAITGVC